jgi:hypothetical protein
MCIQVEKDGKRERNNGERGRDIRRKDETDGKGEVATGTVTSETRTRQTEKERDKWRQGEHVEA